ncbi:MAG: hypothetical protein EBT12_17375 [Marivivens sp.]|nr:hypothetical protein [Marivivens sp.]
MPKYRIRWCETVEYYTNVWASNKDQAIDTFHDLPMNEIPIEPTGFQEMEFDSIKVEWVED